MSTGGLIANWKRAISSTSACVYVGTNNKKVARAAKAQLIKINALKPELGAKISNNP